MALGHRPQLRQGAGDRRKQRRSVPAQRPPYVRHPLRGLLDDATAVRRMWVSLNHPGGASDCTFLYSSLKSCLDGAGGEQARQSCLAAEKAVSTYGVSALESMCPGEMSERSCYTRRRATKWSPRPCGDALLPRADRDVTREGIRVPVGLRATVVAALRRAP